MNSKLCTLLQEHGNHLCCWHSSQSSLPRSDWAPTVRQQRRRSNRTHASLREGAHSRRLVLQTTVVGTVMSQLASMPSPTSAEPSTASSSTQQSATGSAPSQPQLRIIQDRISFQPSVDACPQIDITGSKVMQEAPASCRTQDIPVRLYLPESRLQGLRSETDLPPPLVAIFSPGFLVSSEAYDSYLRFLAASGVPAAVYDVPQSATDPIDDVTCTEILGTVMGWCQGQPQVQAFLQDRAALPLATQTARTDSNQEPADIKFMLCGHSRGGKISTLQAALGEQNRRQIAGLALLDPADASFEGQGGNPRNPSAAELLGELTARERLPLLVIGSGRNKDCIPRNSNYESFYKEAKGDATLIVVKEAGHFVFLDKQTLLQQSACNLGKADPASVRAACALSLLSFANMISSYSLENSGCSAVSFALSWMFESAKLKYEVQTK
ncbi:Alpha/beta hydrolase family-domain-containing protein [Dunaliella salina]|uniref:Alpha/beta hydrolase family-domain-containing protein n=1 Tax=Dunaliella salina TaxID=3046 RepID=A0ABQ7GG18_DUNSA|nr:Alpha/beta hydrolase family-domain-containing protein [Dunaliella salina]|eukprot:KAF5833553.1 Alpha/beta hydrolase family-domain-containing protein [Dunaliella salina]